VDTADATNGTMPYSDNLGTFAGTTNGNFAFLQYLLGLRAAHPAFRQQDYNEKITFTHADGSAGFSEWSNPAVTIYIPGSTVGDRDFVVLCNLSAAAVAFAVPGSPAGTHWVRLIDTGNWAEASNNSWGESGSTMGATYGVGNQSIVVLEAVTGTP
jgi:pullulanase/glycogen debranching enzyme